MSRKQRQLYLWTLIVVFGAINASTVAAAPAPAASVRETPASNGAQVKDNTKIPIAASDDSNGEYSRVLAQLEKMDKAGQRAALLSNSFFQSLSWIGRTASINYVCGVLAVDQCRRILERALEDDALVVRDHALRLMISAKQFAEEEKRAAAERAIGDLRNYRKGRPFWIVDRARGYLASDAQATSPR